MDQPPPEGISERLSLLSSLLSANIPARRIDGNLLVATWNLRAFGDLTDKWEAGEDDSPKRDLGSIVAIAEILSRFDVIAVQEIRGNLKALRHTLKALGPDWGFILTDTNAGAVGNDERMAFLFDTRRVKPSGLAGELVVPPEWRDTIGVSLAAGQFARTPYAVSFASGGETFVLVTLHVLYGDTPADRTGELEAIALWMAGWAKREEEWGHNLIVLGDFNIDRKGDPNYEAFTSTGLTPPPELEGLARTIFDDDGDNFYDQVAWFTKGKGSPLLSLAYSGQGGSFDFVPALKEDLDLTALSWKISDHFPLWVEFLTG